MNKKLIIGIIIGGIIFGSIGVYAGNKMPASDVSINTPTGSSLESGATLQDSLDELYSIADNNDATETRLKSLETNVTNLTNTVNNKKSTQTLFQYLPSTSIATSNEQTICTVNLTAGIYILYFHQVFPSNKTGYRKLKLTTPSGSWATTEKNGASQNGNMSLNITAPFVSGGSNTINFVAEQTSGSTLTGSTICQVIKLS